MSYVFHRDTRQELPVAFRGDGPYLIDDQGRRYLDASGGAAVSCLGHSYGPVIAEIKAQLDRLPYAHTGFFTSEAAEGLAQHLIERAPPGLAKVHFCSGGSEANETALKLARQYFVERGEPARRRVIARRQSYHGATLGALSVSGDPRRRAPFEPLLPESTLIGSCNPYRGPEPGETLAAYGWRAAGELEAAILDLGPETVAAFIAEPVVGMTAGALPAAPGYFKRIRDICDRYGVLLILDEVMCGLGRTGPYFACEPEGVVPDLLTCAKGLGAGYQPIGAVLVGGHIYEAIAEGSGAFQHGFTYVGHPTACAAALAVQHEIERQGLLDNVRWQGGALMQALEQRFAGHDHVGDIRGRGLFIGVELVADRASKTPFSPGHGLHARIKRQAIQRGLLCFPNGGTADGLRGDHVQLSPPFIIDESHVAEIVETLGEAVDAALDEIRPRGQLQAV